MLTSPLSGALRAEQEVRRLLVAHAEQARQADDLAAAHVDREVLDDAAADVVRAQRELALHLVRARIQLAQRPPEDALDQVVLAQRRRGGGLHVRPVAQDRDPVGERADLLQPVRDEEHADALGRDRADGGEEPLHAVAWKVRRGLVQDEHAALLALQPVERAHDRDQRALDLAQRAHLGLRLDVAEPERPQRLAHALALAPPGDAPAHARLEVADAQVLEHGHLRHEPEVLVDEREPEQMRLPWVERQRDRRTGDRQARAVVGRVVAREDLDERRLARAVLPQQAVHLTRQDVQVEALQDGLPRERLREVPRGQNGVGGRLAHEAAEREAAG